MMDRRDSTSGERKEKIRYGTVLVSNGRSKPVPMRLRLSPDAITLQRDEGGASSGGETESKRNSSPGDEAVFTKSPTGDSTPDSRIREVLVCRQRTGGLGFSIKGGAEHRLPVLVSRIVRGQAADQTGQLFVGDAILRVNGRVVTNVTHDEAVNLLRAAGNEVTLTVKHYRAATPFLQRGSSPPFDEEINESSGITTVSVLPLPRCSRSSSNECLPGSDQSLSNSSGRTSPCSTPREHQRWSDVVSVPLVLAYFTRYIFGTDKLRPNAFEVRGVDGSTTGIVHCEDAASLSQWMKHIVDNIVGLTNLQITLHNRGINTSEKIAYMGWVSEGLLNGTQLWQNWQPRFLAVKGQNAYLFETPPRCPEDWESCPDSFALHQSLFRVLKASENVDERQHCFLLQTLGPNNNSTPLSDASTSHYLSVETRQELLRLEAAWHRAVCNAVNKLGSKTFMVTSEGRDAGLTLDLTNGFGLYDTESKNYTWRYRFSQLRGSSDDGKCRLRLHFQDPDTGKIDIREVECSTLQSLLFCMHAFLTAKVASVDPQFLAVSTKTPVKAPPVDGNSNQQQQSAVQE